MGKTAHSASRTRSQRFWIGFVLTPPLVAVVAGLITVFIAQQGADSLVADDYYKAGLAINQTLAADRRAVELGVTARLWLSEGRLRVRLSAPHAAVPTDQLLLSFTHPTLAHQDRQWVLPRIAPGLYESPLPVFSRAHWHLQLRAEQANWRLQGRWQSPFNHPLTLKPTSASAR